MDLMKSFGEATLWIDLTSERHDARAVAHGFTHRLPAAIRDWRADDNVIRASPSGEGDLKGC